MKALKNLSRVIFVLFFLIAFSAEARAEIAVPKIIKLAAGENLIVAGQASAETEILIYVDGNFAGQAETDKNFNFQYSGMQKLADGSHAVMAVAKDKTSLVLSAPSDEVKFTVNLLPAPTLIAPNQITITAKTKPVISGLTKSGSFVKIFIDNIYDGRTEILNDESDTADFAYEPAFDLSRGRHEIYAMAEDVNGKISGISEVLNFNIELPMPAPVALKPVVNKNSSSTRPFIVGLAKNNAKIKIFIDEKYNGEFDVKNHPSGAANFAYKPFNALERGRHSVCAVAVDKRGKQSDCSNTVYFSVKISAIAQSAEEENTNSVARIEEPKKNAKAVIELPVVSEISGSIEEKSEISENNVDNLITQDYAGMEKIKDLIQDNAGEKIKDGKGMINEGKSSQGKLKLSFAMFILFFIGAVAWLLWVNRELVKEQRARNENEDNREENKIDNIK